MAVSACEGFTKRGSPYNANFQPKLLREAITDAFGNASSAHVARSSM
jgi:hypothetical protein